MMQLGIPRVYNLAKASGETRRMYGEGNGLLPSSVSAQSPRSVDVSIASAFTALSRRLNRLVR